ncbi:hypothetical protein RsS62_31650 [Rhizobium dioscoreae]|uniref:Uncharacterized protein n=1 Tax=Rhizobium dioscoreae TaxID=2653122 RepID=A0ABQ0Z0C0_9HYPH|nr:hypothetical protein FBZ99_109201 [Rhizobium sp. ERR1071]GES43913.1 hypothetical protein RsS62_31650 [Rhizobium dioscoreae]GES48724.1 hypothetical protein RsS93_13380 [Rhizobium dioscoreae]GLU80167.1 hypothetical protein Rhsp01_13430 [Rhizobium sp. NBRC 114257]
MQVGLPQQLEEHGLDRVFFDCLFSDPSCLAVAGKMTINNGAAARSDLSRSYSNLYSPHSRLISL